MNDINFRIISLINTFAGGNNSEFAKMIDVNEANIRSYVKGTEPKFNVIQKIAEKFEINYEWLLLGTGEMEKAQQAIKEPKAEYNRMPTIITIDSNDRDNIPLVRAKARAGYLDGYYKPEYMESLPMYRFPGLNNGTFRAFEVKGHSMNRTFHNKSVVVGEWVENWVRDIKDNRIYIIVYDDGDKVEDGVLIKRCLNRIKKYNNIVCKSDNLDRKSYPNLSIDPSAVKEVWELKLGLNAEFPDPSDLFERMDNFEAELEEMKRLLMK
jgi:phage repressor protein C with HTH and peptisase S24 domain